MRSKGTRFDMLKCLSSPGEMRCYLVLVVVSTVFCGIAYSFSFNIFHSATCLVGECCRDDYVLRNHEAIKKLKTKLQIDLHGQHLIFERLVPAIQNHIMGEPKKALVISMHGWTGVGKNYVSDMIRDSIYYKGSESKFVKLFTKAVHFPSLNPTEVERYKEYLQATIKSYVSSCERSLFIFDEVDKIAPGIVDSIKPFMDFHPNIDGIDYRKSIFIFLSNIGGGSITKRYRELWGQGMSRENMKYIEFEPLLRSAAYEEGALQDADIIGAHLVSLYLPFLPLERKHVTLCIHNEMRKQRYMKPGTNDVSKILDELSYDTATKTFSTSGCKRIAELVGILKVKHMEF